MSKHLAGLVLAGALAASSALAEESLVKPSVLHDEVLTTMPRGAQQQVRVLTATFKPGQQTPFHTHRFPVAVYVLEGAFTLEMQGHPVMTMKAGESLVEAPGTPMTGYNRSTGQTRVVIFYVSDPGTPFLDPVDPSKAP